MAQPLNEGFPAFCLSLFGSDNCFTSSQVTARWEWMEKQAYNHGIKILGFSGDGDTRLLKSMKFETFTRNLELPPDWQPFFAQLLTQDEIRMSNPHYNKAT